MTTGDTQPTAPLPEVRWTTVADEPRRRGRGWIVLVVVLVVVALLVVAGEVAARALAPKIIRDQLVSNLGLPADQQIDVEIPGLLLPQLAVGSVAEITLASDDIELDGLAGDVRVDLQDVPVWGGVDWSGGSAQIILDEAQTRALLARVDGFPVDAFRLAEPEVALETEFDVFGASIPLGVRLTAEARDRDLVLSPTTLLLGDAEVSADAVRQQLGPLVGSFLDEWTVCLAQYLPAALTLDDVQVEDRGVVARFEIDSGILRDPAMQANGTCE
ncbi:LmeA family phospholipid-binding protein [uncultured Microbacterium sp.]|uniref:DUF2993 domain-containing protein n=1 Tax=uncultured Microbacterium sp. TaxID=191216 RepID=A0A1Y5P796_9MICO|nr:LmeA family phospholipid-binding protein [uncultured Microbacterium sp.]SBS74507.1 conserved hypothetical protein [uncultured Microbacterium sp.]